MKNIPLYDVRKINDLRDMLSQSMALFSDHTAFFVKDQKGGAYRSVKLSAYNADVESFGTALHNLGLAGCRVAIIAETRYEWYVTYLATVNGVGIIVPLDKELPSHELASLLNRSRADVLVYSQAKANDIAAIRNQIPAVRCFICTDQPTPATPDDLYFADLLVKGRTLLEAGDRRFADYPLDPDAMRILLFTSGTTDQAKAVMLSHHNVCANLMAMSSMIFIGTDDTFLSVLPLHHTYECICGFLCQIYRGSAIAVCEGLRYIPKNMQESHVTIMLVVPLMLEMFYKRIMKTVNADPATARKFKIGRLLSNFLLKLGIDRRRQIFKQIHESFGGKIHLFISGGAPVDPKVLRGMRELGILCVQGYGLTECAPILAVNRDCDYNDASAGMTLPGVDIKIIDPDENGIGEICGCGANVMLGYYENPEATAAAIDQDKYFHSGDLGYIDKDGFVIITGRKKNVIVTKNGKNIFPEEIETLLGRSEYVAECLVSGIEDESGEWTVKAEIFPNMEAIQPLLGNVAPDSEAVRNLISEEIRKVNHLLETYKYVRTFNLRTVEFEKTTSKKIRRQYKK
ncbi:MAG: AMP-binding protein [Clostridiaceae bacterium]|nr:AMP-binding protein [Clostridiaceae bacterium]